MKSNQHSPIHTLLVEEDFAEANVYAQHIASVRGFSLAAIAASSEEALNYLEALQIELLVIDQFISSMTGIELLIHIRRIGLEVDAILISTIRERNNVQLALRYGSVDYLVKPVSPERFYAALQGYRERAIRIYGLDSLEQTDIDNVIHAPHMVPGFSLPKGLDPVTLEAVRKAVSTFSEEFSTQDMASVLGISRVTTRKYLAYMKDLGELQVRLEYRVAGRPLTLFKTVKEKQPS